MAAETVEQDGVSAEAVTAALKDLLQSEGWRLLREQALREWGAEGYGNRMQEAITKIPPGPDRAYQLAEVAERVDATARAVNDLIAWPSQQVRRLSEPNAPKRAFARFRRSPER